jgi:hypothetical protein
LRTEEEVRRFYRDYVMKYANANLKGDRDATNQYFGAAIACGRTLGKDVKRIKLDFQIAEEHIRRTTSD